MLAPSKRAGKMDQILTRATRADKKALSHQRD